MCLTYEVLDNKNVLEYALQNFIGQYKYIIANSMVYLNFPSIYRKHDKINFPFFVDETCNLLLVNNFGIKLPLWININ